MKYNYLKNAFRRIVQSNRLLRACGVVLALCGITSSAVASVDYVRDIAKPAYMGESVGASILSISQAPFDAEGTNALPYLTDPFEFSALNLSIGEFQNPPPAWPTDFRRSIFTLQSWVGQSPAGPILIGLQATRLYTYNVTDDYTTSAVYIDLLYTTRHSLAVRSLDAPISFLADDWHYTINLSDGVTTEMSLFGVDTATTHFMAYGADGLLYVLDYGNSRIASFDPDAAFAPITSFDLEDGVTVANEQFAIGINESFYLSDGTGGGSYYNGIGEFQGVFNSGGVTGTGYNGQSYINTDASGAVLVYDAETGIHQYQDTSVVPEPSTWALLGLGGAGPRHRPATAFFPLGTRGDHRARRRYVQRLCAGGLCARAEQHVFRRLSHCFDSGAARCQRPLLY